MVEKPENMFKQHAIRQIVLRSKLVALPYPKQQSDGTQFKNKLCL